MIPEDIINHISTPGQGVTFGSVNEQLQPHVGRALAVKTEAGKNSVSFFVSRGLFESHKSDLEKNRKVSVTVTYPPTHKSYQFKGNCIEWLDAPAGEKELSHTNVHAFHQILVQYFGEESAKHFLKYDADDLVQVKMDVNEVFDQTPGPGAGRKVYPNN